MLKRHGEQSQCNTETNKRASGNRKESLGRKDQVDQVLEQFTLTNTFINHRKAKNGITDNIEHALL